MWIYNGEFVFLGRFYLCPGDASIKDSGPPWTCSNSNMAAGRIGDDKQSGAVTITRPPLIPPNHLLVMHH